MMKWFLALALVGCTTTEPVPTGPDAGSDTPTIEPVELTDAGADSMPDAPACWQYVTFNCGNVIYQFCVPYSGCSESVECNGQSLAYCHAPSADAGVDAM